MTTNYAKGLSERISKFRKQNGLTQEQLANRLGVTSQAVSKWENEQSCPDISLLPALSDLFRISLDELFGRSSKTIDLRKGLITEYLFNGDAQDTSGNGFHGKVVGATLCKDRFGNFQSAYYFDGVDDFIVVEPAPIINHEAFSLSVWCCYDDISGKSGWHNAIVSQDGHHNRRVFQLSTRNSNITFHRFLLEPDLYVEAPVHKGFWYHIVITYENQMFQLYKNGVLICKQHGSIVPDTKEPLYIGRKSTDEPYFFFQGMIDDVRLYNRALSEEEVHELFLEDNWKPRAEPFIPKAENVKTPILECVDDIQVTIPKDKIKAAADWYVKHLDFKLLIEQDEEFYMLSLYKGPNLLLHSSLSVAAINEELSPVIFKTKWDIEKLVEKLTAAGAKVKEIRDEGFAHFIDFQDPFARNWAVMREK
ncbi:DNA-binding XRE family transcriptional regulator [Bacillus oleivorans]|uniref:DNA-binding XRE family transcriptional regulator n=1 Tax=Bacillus oleivorans TaxID=1448271 RepID=A0A285CTI1_9BACI|nr:LamG-like jellyroll fold domain-containing protein [Bacillus oleivorans]SNX70824.1 DNA-binding XRE family transcriptional regulator [Bacillus oleivorans]